MLGLLEWVWERLDGALQGLQGPLARVGLSVDQVWMAVWFVVAVLVVGRALKWQEARAREKELAEVARRTRAARDKRSETLFPPSARYAPREEGVTRELEEFLLGASVRDLQRRYARGTLLCEHVLLTMAWRANRIGLRKFNAVTEEFLDEALEAARTIDNEMEEFRRQEELGEDTPDDVVDAIIEDWSLYGIPVSIKDQTMQRGAVSSCGTAVRAMQPPHAKDGLLVELLRDAGAIPYVRSNVPQLMLLPECDNHVWGLTTNPWDTTRGPGGSSGGEGALIASRSSIVGLGSDIGGSIRIPAHFCGVAGFRPTPMRVSAHGAAQPIVGQKTVLSSRGPLAKYVDDLARMMQAFWVSKHFAVDSTVPMLVFDWDVYATGDTLRHQHLESLADDAEVAAAAENTAGNANANGATDAVPRPTFLPNGKRRMRIGFFTTDNFFQPCPSAVRAVNETAEALRAEGHEVVPFHFPVIKASDMPIRWPDPAHEDTVIDGWFIARVYFCLFGAEGNMHSFTEGLAGEAISDSYSMLHYYANLSNTARAVLVALTSVLGDRRRGELAKVTRHGGLSVRQVYPVQHLVKLMQQAYTREMDAQGLDALLYPAVSLVAYPHGVAAELTLALTYCFLANLLHYPSGTVPVTTVRKEEEAYCRPDMSDLPANQRDPVAKTAQKVCTGSAGMSVSVQVMTRTYEDELCLHIMHAVETAVAARDEKTQAAGGHGNFVTNSLPDVGYVSAPDEE